MKHQRILSYSIALVGLLGAGAAQATIGTTADWSEEFTGTALNTAVWTHDTGGGTWGNGELECYQAKNVSVSGGFLTISAKKETVTCGGGSYSYTSSRITTARKKAFTYGRLEMRAKLPAGKGMWPAFWMLGADLYQYSGTYNPAKPNEPLWPTGTSGAGSQWPNSGEIDIMEAVGSATGISTTTGTLHYSNTLGVYTHPTQWYTSTTTKLSDNFHVYAVDWTPTSIAWSLDGVKFLTVPIGTANTAVFAKPFFVLLNLAVGGTWPGSPDASTVFPQTYVIDYVRHYPYLP